MNNSTLAQSKKWHDEADKLLEDSQLTAVLSAVGEVRMSGSYDYDLMLGADIDINVIVPQDTSRASALKALHSLIEQNYWNGYLLYNFEDHTSKYHPEFPKAYYVGVKADYADHRWKVDMWFGEEGVLSEKNSWIKQALSANTKGVILELKQARNNGDFAASSYQIYDAVLRHNIVDGESFKSWLKERTE